MLHHHLNLMGYFTIGEFTIFTLEKRLIIKQDVLSALAQFYLQKLTMKMSIASMYIVTGKMFNNLGPNRIC